MTLIVKCLSKHFINQKRSQMRERQVTAFDCLMLMFYTKKGLKCGKDNCVGTGFDSTDDCCMLPGGGDKLFHHHPHRHHHHHRHQHRHHPHYRYVQHHCMLPGGGDYITSSSSYHPHYRHLHHLHHHPHHQQHHCMLLGGGD